MCARFRGIHSLDLLLARFRPEVIPFARPERPNWNVPPTRFVPVLRRSSSLVVEQMQWGFHVPWTSQPVINAQAATAPEKRTFAQSFRERRCVVPSEGFIEWDSSRGPKAKVPVLFSVPDEPITYLAGLWRLEDTPEGPVNRFVVLTTVPNSVLSTIHDRQALPIATDQVEQWLDPGTPPEALLAMCAMWPAERLRAQELPRGIGSVKVDTEEVATPIGPWVPPTAVDDVPESTT